MEKIFTPNKWFVLFCAVFIGIFASLNFVITTRLASEAKQYGVDIFSWVWLDKNLCATADMTDAKVLKRGENDAVVEVSGEQVVSPFEDNKPTDKGVKNSCKAILTFYRFNNDWKLGRVELE